MGNVDPNKVFAGPAAAPAASPTFRTLVAGDIPSLSLYDPIGSAASAQAAAIAAIADDTKLSPAMQALKTAPPTHGSSVHDSTVSKKRVLRFPMASEWAAGLTWSSWDYRVWWAIRLDISSIDKISAVYLEVTGNTSAGTFSFRLYNLTGGAVITGSQIDITGAGVVVYRSADIKANLSAGLNDYVFQAQVTAGQSGAFGNIGLVVEQSE